MASSHLIFLGTYTKTGPSEGIYAIRLDGDTGALSAPTLVAKGVDPAWVTLSPNRKFLYAIHPSSALAMGFTIEAGATPRLTPLTIAPSAAANPPSHLAVDATGRTLLAANYRDGFVAALPIHADGSLGVPTTTLKHEGSGPNRERQEKPHVHSVTISPDNRFVIVADLGTDKVHSYALDAAHAKLTPAAQPFATVPPGGGPRHAKFSRDGKRVYVTNEMGGSVTVFDYNAATGALAAKQTIATVPEDYTGLKWNAEVRVHPNGKFLYNSNRAHDSLAVFAIAPETGLLARIEIVPSGGKTPRNFALSPDGKWLVCAHQDTPQLTVFAVDQATGKLTRTSHTANVAACVCVEFYD